MSPITALILFAVLIIAIPDPIESKCPEGSIVTSCTKCIHYCKVKNWVCDKDPCVVGCICTESQYVMGPDYDCIPWFKCPKWW
ncbi:hypothetical protein GDO81_024129 [Engystomops pustulosus]|uniref:TIL domain-containing protein n=1 Tax=Engystomops pustulosus TaxID=76066 RepID=A0AAV6ZHL8_ENGPU|nr:hypothetical protein GDO81_024129 [Engystomops pustulosus]